MALGSPSISSPRFSDREVSLAVNNIRERIENIEAEFALLNHGPLLH